MKYENTFNRLKGMPLYRAWEVLSLDLQKEVLKELNDKWNLD